MKSSKKLFESIKLESKIPSIKYLTLDPQKKNLNSSSKKSSSNNISNTKFEEMIKVGKEM